MRKMSLFKLMLVLSLAAAVFAGCGKKAAQETIEDETVISESEELSTETIDAIEELYSVQINYSNGTAPLNIIPSVVCQNVYDNWDAIEASDNDKAPVMLREYVEPEVVFFDYDTDYSIKWNKETGDVMVDKTDVAAREDYKQKSHK